MFYPVFIHLNYSGDGRLDVTNTTSTVSSISGDASFENVLLEGRYNSTSLLSFVPSVRDIPSISCTITLDCEDGYSPVSNGTYDYCKESKTFPYQHIKMLDIIRNLTFMICRQRLLKYTDWMFIDIILVLSGVWNLYNSFLCAFV